MYSPYYLGKIKYVNLGKENNKPQKYVLVKECINPKAFISIHQDVFRYKDINSKEIYMNNNFSDMIKLDVQTSMKDLMTLKHVATLYKLRKLTPHGKKMVKKIERKINNKIKL